MLIIAKNLTNFDPAKKKLNNPYDMKGQEFLSFIASGTSSVTSFWRKNPLFFCYFARFYLIEVGIYPASEIFPNTVTNHKNVINQNHPIAPKFKLFNLKSKTNANYS